MGHGVCETFAYDDYGRPLKHRHADGNSTEWQRDRLGRVLAMRLLDKV